MKVINDLFDYENYKIVQDNQGFKFSLDSILLAEFTKLNKDDKVLDLCTGNAAVPLILSYYFPNSIVGFEIQETIYNLGVESVILNHKEEQIQLINDDKKKAIARHEIFLNIENIFQIAKTMLKNNGTLYLVHLPSRLEEIFNCCEKYKITVKELQFVYTKETECATIVLIKCVKNARKTLKVNPPLYVKRMVSYKNCFRG